MNCARSRRAVLIGVAAVASLLAVAACSGASSGGGATSEGGGGGSSGSGSDASNAQFVFAAESVPSSLDLMANYEGDSSFLQGNEWAGTLVRYKTNLPNQGCNKLENTSQFEPALATSWTETNHVLTFKLRHGVKSQYGHVMTSKDVAWTFNRGLKVSPIYQLLFFDVGDFAHTNTITTDGAYTVKVHVNHKSSIDVALFSYMLTYIIDSTEAKAHATASDPWAKKWLSTHMATFGPWKLDTFKPSSQVEYTPNPNYWDTKDRGNIAKYIIRAIPDASTRAQLLRSGNVEYAEKLSFEDYRGLSKDKAFNVLNCPSQYRDTLALNLQSPQFKNPKVRQAVSLAINRSSLAKSVYLGFATPATTGVSSVFLDPRDATADEKFDYDAARARKLLKEAGMPHGFKFKLLISPTRPGAHSQALAIAISGMLAKIGVTPEIQVVADATQFNTLFSKHEFTAMVQYQPPAVASPCYSLKVYLNSKSYLNATGYKNATFDGIVNQICTTPPGSHLNTLLGKASKMIVDDTAIAYLVERSEVIPLPTDVHGYVRTPTATLLAYRLTVS